MPLGSTAPALDALLIAAVLEMELSDRDLQVAGKRYELIAEHLQRPSSKLADLMGSARVYAQGLPAEEIGDPVFTPLVVCDPAEMSEPTIATPEHMIRTPEVREVHLTTGEYDYLIKVAVRGTKGYELFLRQKLYRVKGIRHSRSCVILRSLKDVQASVPDPD